MSIQSIIFLAILFAAAFYAGWQACRRHYTRPAPTPLYRDACAVKMNDHRVNISREISCAFYNGTAVGFNDGFVVGQMSMRD